MKLKKKKKIKDERLLIDEFFAGNLNILLTSTHFDMTRNLIFELFNDN